MVALCDRAGEVREGEELDVVRLQQFLLERFGYGGAVYVEQFPSGHSNLTYLIRMGAAGMGNEQTGEGEFVLRRPPFGSKVRSAHDMGREYRVLSKLHTAYAVAPKTLLYCDDPSILNAPFYLMDRIRGIILRRDPPANVSLSPETARRLSEAFIENLARLHRLDYAAIGLSDLGKPQGYLERQVQGWI
jgi:aminoglycoside phosphotransferase (APT) family kinase protein